MGKVSQPTREADLLECVRARGPGWEAACSLLLKQHEEHQRRLSLSDDERSNLVNATLKQLPPKAREVLGLRFSGDASLDDIARTLGINLSAAKMRLYRALELFAANYPNQGVVDMD